MYAVGTVPKSTPSAPDDVWHALADTTRRQLIDRLAEGPQTTGALCDGFAMSRFGVMKHLGILERSGLVIFRREGRTRINHLNAAPLYALSSRWLSPRASNAAQAAHGFAARAEPFNQEESAMPTPADPLSHVDVALDLDIGGSIQTVWRLLFDKPETWWPADFRAGPAGSRMVLDERVGGSLREERADGGGLLWYSVIALDPLRSLDLAGHLASRYGGPATTLLHIELAPGTAEGSTLFKLTDSVFGKLGPGFKASAASGWQAIFGDSFKTLAEQT